MAAALPTVDVADDVSNMQNWLQKEWADLSLEKVLSTVILALICFIGIRLIMRILTKLTDRSSLDKRVQRAALRVVRGVLYTTAVLILLDSVGFPVASLVALAGVLGLALSLAVQDVLSNIAGGMVLLFSKPFTLGDYISTGDSEGTVEEIGLTHTKLDTFSGQRVMLPNSKLTAGKIVNYTTKGVRRVDHSITASYDDSTESVRAACLKAVADAPGVLQDPAPVVLVSSYGESSIQYTVRFWTRTEDYWNAYSTSLESIRRHFDEDGVTMTYDHLNVHIIDPPIRTEK